MEKEEKIERICVKEFGFSPSYFIDLRENFADVLGIVKDYIDISGGLDERRRREIARISFKANRLKILFHKMFMISDQLVNEARAHFLLKKELKKQDNRIKEVEKAVSVVEEEFKALLEDLEKMTSEIERIY